MNPNDPNVAMMELVAERLGNELRERLVFIGGEMAGTLTYAPGQTVLGPTEGGSLIFHAAVRAHYQNMEEGL